MDISTGFFFGQVLQWDILTIVSAAIICMIAVSVWFIRNHYRFVFLSVSWVLFLLFLAFGTWRTVHEERAFRETWEKALCGITRSFASTTETMGHAKITRETQSDDPIYKNIQNVYTKWCNDLPAVACIYTLRYHNNEKHKVDWIIRCESDADQNKKIEGHVENGAGFYEPSEEWYNACQQGFDGKTVVDEEYQLPGFGKFVTVIVPLRDPETPDYIEAVLGVAFRDNQWRQMNSQMRATSLLFLTLTPALYLTLLCFVVVSYRTVSKLTETNQELIVAKRNADAATKAKNDFLTNMSHEIRTPMNALVGFSDILTQRIMRQGGHQEREEAEGILEIIKKSSQDLLTIINDILDFSRIESNQLQLDSVPLSIKQVIEDSWQMVRANIVANHLDFAIKYKEPVPELIVGDPARLRQILLHLLDNAVKFTQTGKIEIHCQMLAAPSGGSDPALKTLRETDDPYQFHADSSVLKIDVVDTGIGISPEQMQRLFQPFTQVDTSTTRNFGGTGLGLSIAKRLAELMDGNITVESKPNVGSTFTLTLQVYFPPEHDSAIIFERRRMEEAKKGSKITPGLEIRELKRLDPLDLPDADPSAADKPLHNVRILLVEDMQVNQLVISTQLQDAGAKVEVTDNGKLGIQKITENMDNGLFFDVVLMDMQMPVMDGYEAVSTLRMQGYTRPIIAVTAHALTGDREKTLAVGCDDYITKPVDRKVLIETIKKYL